MYVCMYGKVLDALAFFFYHLPTLEPSQILFSYVFALTIARARAPSAAKMLTDKGCSAEGNKRSGIQRRALERCQC